MAKRNLRIREATETAMPIPVLLEEIQYSIKTKKKKVDIETSSVTNSSEGNLSSVDQQERTVDSFSSENNHLSACNSQSDSPSILAQDEDVHSELNLYYEPTQTQIVEPTSISGESTGEPKQPTSKATPDHSNLTSLSNGTESTPTNVTLPTNEAQSACTNVTPPTNGAESTPVSVMLPTNGAKSKTPMQPSNEIEAEALRPTMMSMNAAIGPVKMSEYRFIDRMPVGVRFQLLCLPNVLQLASIVIGFSLCALPRDCINFEVQHLHSYLNYFRLLAKSLSLILPKSGQAPTRFNHKKYRNEIGSVTFVSEFVDSKFNFTIMTTGQNFKLSLKATKSFLIAFNQMALKVFCYSPNTHYILSRYWQMAPIKILQYPNTKEVFEIFSKIDHFYLDFFFVYELVQRHSKVMIQIKEIDALLNLNTVLANL